METKTIIKMTWKELENMVKLYYPKTKNYSFIAVEEADNDTSYEFNNISKANFERDFKEEPKQVAEMIKCLAGINNFPMYRNRLLLLFLCWIELIPEGDYLITVSW